ncbi:MAG TPA: hypothetical protein DCR31_05085 [Ruminococcaceae bacterium]|nr:hypothetical protein [Oscillospiraceae bacterium]
MKTSVLPKNGKNYCFRTPPEPFSICIGRAGKLHWPPPLFHCFFWSQRIFGRKNPYASRLVKIITGANDKIYYVFMNIMKFVDIPKKHDKNFSTFPKSDENLAYDSRSPCPFRADMV